MLILKRAAAGGLALLAFGLTAPATSLARSDPPAGVQAPAVPEANERAALGHEVAETFLGSIDYKGWAVKKLQSNPSVSTLVRLRPDWSDLLLKVAEQVYTEQYAGVVADVGDALADGVPLDELRNAAAFFKTPAGLELLRAMKEKTSGKPVTPFSAEGNKGIAAFRDSPLGGDFLKRLANGNTLLAPAMLKSESKIFPFLLRFGTQSEAMEKARIAALSPDTEAQALTIRMLRAIHFTRSFKAGIVQGIEQARADQASTVVVSDQFITVLGDAMRDAVDLDEADIARIAGRAEASYYTLAELRAGTLFLESSAGQALLAQGQHDGKKPKPLTAQQSLAIRKFEMSRAGMSFMKKGGLMEKALDETQADLMPLVLATSYRLAGERLTAAQIKGN